MKRLEIVAVCLVFAATCSAYSHAASIDVGNFNLEPDTAGQIIMLFAAGEDMVGGLELDVQIGDGGEANEGTDTGPTITDVDLETDTALGLAGGVQVDVVIEPLLRQSSIDIFPETVSVQADSSPETPPGKIATLTIDTTGISAGVFDLLLTGVASEMPELQGAEFDGFDTTFFDGDGLPIDTAIANGTITVVPEPSALTMAALGAIAGLIALMLHRRRQ